MTRCSTSTRKHSRLIDQIGINALLALSLSVSLQAGQLALAQAAFMGIAAYVVGDPRDAVPLAAARGVRVAAAARRAVVAALLAFPVRQLRGIFLAIATIGFGEIVRVIANNLPITGGAEGFSSIPNDANTPAIYGALAVVALALFALSRTKFALAVALMREDEYAARGVGVDVGTRALRLARARRRDRRARAARSTRTRRSSSRRPISDSPAWSRSWSGA